MTAKAVLVHLCCAHCAAYTVRHWRELGYTVSAYWYNPNIHPFLEHQNRLEAVRKLAVEMDFPLTVAPGYDIVEYFWSAMRTTAAATVSASAWRRRRRKPVIGASPISPAPCSSAPTSSTRRCARAGRN